MQIGGFSFWDHPGHILGAFWGYLGDILIPTFILSMILSMILS